jgi:hypothetical protein
MKSNGKGNIPKTWRLLATISPFIFLLLLVVLCYLPAARGFSFQGKTEVKKRGEKSGKVMVLIDEPVKVGLESDAVSRQLAQKLSAADLSVTFLSDLNAEDVARMRRSIQKLQRGDKKAGNSIPSALIIMGKVSVTNLDPFNSLYMADAYGSLKAIDARDGRTVAIETISDARGYGNSQDQAVKNALKKASELISEKFIKQVSSAAQ